MGGTGTDAEFVWPVVRRIAPRAPVRWLAAGWRDLRAAPAQSLFYGAVLAAMGWLLTTWFAGAVGLALTTGFLLVGPFLAVGLYEISRRRECGAPPGFAATLLAWRANFQAIGFYAVLLMLVLAVWLRISTVVVALFFPHEAPTLAMLARMLAESPQAWLFVLAWSAAGAGLALLVFATSAVSLPMLLDREEMDTLSAMITSFNVLRENPAAMLGWAATIVALTTLGFAAWFAGLVLVLPLIGHASWHAYREAVEPR